MHRTNVKIRFPYVPSLHRDRRHHGRFGHSGHRRGRRQRRHQLPQLGHRLEGRPAPRDPLDRRRRHPDRHAHLERHDGGRPQRSLLSRAVLLLRNHDALPGHDAGQRAAARPLQHAGTSDLDHRVDGIRAAGRRRGHRAVPHRGRPLLLAARPLAVHQHGQGHGHHRRHSGLRGLRLRGRHAVHVHLAAHLLVPLPPRIPPLGRVLVRHIALGHPLLRPFQGSQEFGTDPLRHHAVCRRARPADALRLLGRGVAHPVDTPADAVQHHADHDPLGNLRPGAGLRRQRPGELHRRADGQLRRPANRPRRRQRVDHDGRTGPSRPRELPHSARLGSDHGADALLLEKVAPRRRNRAFARLAARGVGALRLDLRVAQPRARHAAAQQPLVGHDSRTRSEGHRPPLRAAARRRTHHGPVRHDPRRGEPHRRIDPHRDRNLLQTAPLDDLRGLHGGDGFVAGRPFVGTRQRRLPHHGRHGRHIGLVHHRARRLSHRPGHDGPAALGRMDRRRRAHGPLRLAARPSAATARPRKRRKPKRLGSRSTTPERPTK